MCQIELFVEAVFKCLKEDVLRTVGEHRHLAVEGARVAGLTVELSNQTVEPHNSQAEELSNQTVEQHNSQAEELSNQVVELNNQAV
jgi:hypothetical protein